MVAIYGVCQIQTDFSMDLFIPKDSDTYKYYEMDMRYFKSGFDVDIIIENPHLDYSSEETQL